MTERLTTQILKFKHYCTVRLECGHVSQNTRFVAM